MANPFESGGQISLGLAQGFRNQAWLEKSRSWDEAKAGSKIPVLSLEILGFDISGWGIGLLAHGHSYLFRWAESPDPIAGLSSTSISFQGLGGKVLAYRETTWFVGPMVALPTPEWHGIRVLPKASIGYSGDLRSELVDRTALQAQHTRNAFRHCLGWTGELTGQWRVWHSFETGLGMRFSDRQYQDFARWDGIFSLGWSL